MSTSQGLCQRYKDKKNLVLSLEELVFFHSRVILLLNCELLTGKTPVVLISVSLVPSTVPGTY